MKRIVNTIKALRAIMEISPDGIGVTSLDGKLQLVSDKLAIMYGYPLNRKKELLSKTIFDFIDPLYHKTLKDNINKLVASQDNVITEYLAIKYNNTRFYVDVNSTSLTDSTGKIASILFVQRDITERKLAELHIKEANEKLEQRVAERTKKLEVINKKLEFHINEIEQFTYIATHDLQEPLRTMINFSNLLCEEYIEKLDQDGKKSIEFIATSALRMRTLVRSLLEYSLLGKTSNVTNVDCNQAIKEVISDLRDSIEGSCVKISTMNLPTIRGYQNELRLLFQNLISNAIKFQKKDHCPEIKISVEEKKNAWIFSVADNGIGIEIKNLEKIFVIFKRMHSQNEYAGTGIGLAHCKKIVELHSGKIWVESELGKGSTFFFTLPK